MIKLTEYIPNAFALCASGSWRRITTLFNLRGNSVLIHQKTVGRLVFVSVVGDEAE